MIFAEQVKVRFIVYLINLFIPIKDISVIVNCCQYKLYSSVTHKKRKLGIGPNIITLVDNLAGSMFD